MPMFEVYVIETVKTYYKPVVVEALSADDAVTMAEELCILGEVDEQDGDSEWTSDAAEIEP